MLEFLDKIPYGTHRLRRVCFWLIPAFLAYAIIGFFVIPPVVKSLIAEQGGAELKRHTSIEYVAFNPLTLRMEFRGLEVDKREGEGQLLSVGSFSARLSVSSLWKLAPVFAYLQLRDLAVDITFFGDGKYSISDLIGSKRTDNTETEQTKNDAEQGTVFPFALYGFEMSNATIVFDDRPHEKRHVISDLNLLVPFTSSFLDMRKEFTQPKFTAVVNGDPVELKGRTLPFDDTLLTEFELGAVAVNLDQYWTYMPIETQLQLKNGRFTSNMSLYFERPDAQRVSLFLGGGGALQDLELETPGDGTVLSLKELTFEMEKYSLGDNELVLKNVTLDQPYFKIIRREDSAISWADYFPGAAITDTGATVATPETDSELRLDIRTLEVKSGALDWIDTAVPGGFKRTFSQFAFKATGISTNGDQPSLFTMSIGKDGFISANGVATIQPLAATVDVDIKDVHIPAYKPYLAQFMVMEMASGTLGAHAKFQLKQEEDRLDLQVDNGTLTVDDLALHKPGAKKPSLGFSNLTISGASMDLGAKSATVDLVSITAPMAKVVREKSGDFDLVRIMAGNEKRLVAKEKEATAQVERWDATIKAVRMAKGAVSYKDLTLKHPADLSLNGLAVDLQNITTREKATMTYAVATNWGGHGTISLDGKVGLDTFESSGNIKLREVGLRPLDGHLGEHTELLFASGAATADLKYTYSGSAQSKLTITGNTALNKVQLKDSRGDGEFAGIDSFKLAGLRFSNEPYRLGIADIHLDGPRAAVDFDENGHLNIRRAFRIPEPPPVDEKGETETSSKEPTKDEKKATTTPDVPVRTAEHEPFFEAIDIGKITMENGRVTFRDASVEPVYYTEISDMKLGIIEITQTPESRPKVDFSAKIGPTPMSVTGVVNPVITPIYSDLAISVNGMELVPLTPYTIKNLAYPVEKGRLYADVTLKTEDWVLSANNKFFIEQLVLGPKDTRPGAPSVPVKFGLALLQDGKGDLELDLPIRGRIDDPDFRIGGIVFKAIASLFIKALASPFSLIGSIFGSATENMDFVVFRPGRHDLDQAGLRKMEATIKALKEREKLKLEVDGVIDPVADKSGLVEVLFENKLKQQKFNSLSRKARALTSVDDMTIGPEEYEEFLFDAYKEEPDLDKIKPTTLFMTDRQPIEFMEKFIIDRIVINEEDLNALAMRRAAAVKNHIINREASLTERVYLLDRRKDKPGKTGVPQHRADLGIK